MSFFDSIPQPPPRPEPVWRPRPVWMQPDEVIPGSVPGELMLIRTEQVAVVVSGIRAYPNGFEFTAHVRRRGNDVDEPGWHDPFDRHGRGRRQSSGEVLRLGLLYADGRRGATTGGHWRPDEAADPGRLVVQHGSSGGNGRRWDGNFWVHPLPPEGPVTFVASWPDYGVGETRAEVDGSAIRAAAAQAVSLWPEEPEIDPGGGGSWSSGTITAYKADESGPQAEPDFEARKAARERFEAAGGKAAVVGKTVEEAEAWCQGHGFLLVLVEQRGGASNLSWSPGRVRLTEDNGVVTDVHLG